MILTIAWGVIGNMFANGWRYGLVKADHYLPIEEINLIQPLLTIPLVINWAVTYRKIYERVQKNSDSKSENV